jgi:single-strand DNA-binding protein
MANLNRVLLIGNLTRDPEVRYTPKGTAVTEIGLAVNRVYSGEDGEKKEEVTFVDVTLWARQAEIAGQYLKKGRPVFIEGRLQLDSWDDKQTGQKRSRLRVVAENLQLLGSRQDAESASSTPGSFSAPAPRRPPSTSAPPPRPEPRDPDLDTEPDDIPF